MSGEKIRNLLAGTLELEHDQGRVTVLLGRPLHEGGKEKCAPFTRPQSTNGLGSGGHEPLVRAVAGSLFAGDDP